MTTTVQSPNHTDPSHDDPADSSAAQPGTDLETAVTIEEVVTGDIVTGPLHLNLGDDSPDLPPIRAGRLDPRQLLDNPRNPRKNLGDLSDLKTSIRAFGVLVPLVVISVLPDTAAGAAELTDDATLAPTTPPGTPINELTDEQIEAFLAPAPQQQSDREQFVIFMGHRRKHAAIEVGRPWVPCWIVPDEGAARQIMAMVLENSHREGLTPTEEADAYHQLTLEGWSAEDIAAVRAVPTSAVNTALRARELPTAAQRALDKGTLTLDQAMALEEFKDSPRASERLLRELNDEWRFKQAVASERDKRDYAIAKERAKATLVLDGVKATAKPAGYGYDSSAVAADDLVDAEGNTLDVDLVKKLPGFAAFVEKVGSQARTVVYCEDAAAHGYTKRPKPSPYGLSAEEAAARAEREQRENEQRDQLRLAAGVRQEFIRATYGTAKAARKLYVEALRAAVAGNLSRWGNLDELYKALGGSDPEVLATAGEDRLRRALVARWVCGQERNLGYTTETYQYHLDRDVAVAWYDRLVGEGYPLSDAEVVLYQAFTAPEPDEEDDEDEDDDTGDLEDQDTGEGEDLDTAGVQDDTAGDQSGEADKPGDGTPVDSSAMSDPGGEERPDGDSADGEDADPDAVVGLVAQVDVEGLGDADHPEAEPVELQTTD